MKNLKIDLQDIYKDENFFFKGSGENKIVADERKRKVPISSAKTSQCRTVL